MEEVNKFIEFCLENQEKLNIVNQYDYPGKTVDLKVFFEIAKLIYKKENTQYLIDELSKIKEILINISVDNYTYNHSYYEFIEERYEYYNKFTEDMEYLENYNGFWNINYFIQFYRLDEDYIKEYKEKVRKKYVPSFVEKAELQQKKIAIEKINFEKFKKDYESKKNNLSKLNINKYEKLEINGENIDIMNIHYPIIIKFIKNNEVISINKCGLNLPKFFQNNSVSEFDNFKIVHVEDEIIDDLIIEYKIKYNPFYNTKGIVQDIKKVYKYRNENQVKRYYKNMYDLAAIKKIVNLYEVSTFTFDSGTKIYNRYELEEAIKKHLQKFKL